MEIISSNMVYCQSHSKSKWYKYQLLWRKKALHLSHPNSFQRISYKIVKHKMLTNKLVGKFVSTLNTCTKYCHISSP